MFFFLVKCETYFYCNVIRLIFKHNNTQSTCDTSSVLKRVNENLQLEDTESKIVFFSGENIVTLRVVDRD